MNKRFSTQKKLIEEAVIKLDHPTASEVYEWIRKEYPKISLGTVYRNLNEMALSGQIMRLSFSGEPDRYDCNAKEHFHMVCSDCGQIFDAGDCIPHSVVQQMDEALLQAAGFEVKAHDVLFHGRCSACRTFALSSAEDVRVI